MLGHAIRLLLEYTETGYEEKRYAMTASTFFWSHSSNFCPLVSSSFYLTLFSARAPDYDRSQWLNDKFKLGLDFSQLLPYLIDGSHKVTQSNAILRYLGRKHNLRDGGGEDSCGHFGETGYGQPHSDGEKRKPEFLKGLPDQLKLYSEFLGKQPWFAGDKITFADFLVYDVLDQHRIFEPKCLDAFPNLMDFVARFEALRERQADEQDQDKLNGSVCLVLSVMLLTCEALRPRAVPVEDFILSSFE
ncbi:Glutathione S-transferase Mu 6 [Apodemus speciosus]|uniref:Glutathione S-transferase n=1 Tax=Apodemus speciosus TaxID=105296 RepID=A0ABQ0ELQ3_APOSI